MSKRKVDSSTEGRNFSIRSCVADLRLRRVFSLGSDSKQIEFAEDGSPYIGSCEAGCSKNPITEGEMKDASKDCEKEKKEKNSDSSKAPDEGLSFSGGISKTEYPPKGILKKTNGSGWDREDLIQTTPPENVIPVETLEENNSQNVLIKRKARVAPYARQKLVHLPGSFSYKRLLPFLMEMDKDEVEVSFSNEEKQVPPIVDSPNPMLSEDLDSAENPVPNASNSEKPEHGTALIFSSADVQLAEIPKSENSQSIATNCTAEPQPSMEIDKDEVQVSSNEKKQFTLNVDSPNPMLSEDLDFAENPVLNTTNLEKPEHATALILDSSDAQSGEISKSENAQSNTTNCTVEPQPPLDNSIQASKILCRTILASSLPSVQGTLTVDELSSGSVHERGKIGTSPEMGEIKRDSTKGCKVACMCLDCVLLRTHAQRSSEFSKKQLIEADEIISGLVTEFSGLRSLLEKFIGEKSCDSSQAYRNEIKAACERASQAEKLATTRTKQMFMDLGAHCILQEQRIEISDALSRESENHRVITCHWRKL